MDILNVTYPFENEDHGARFEVVLRDAYGNVVKTLDESDLSFDSTLGEVFASLDEESGYGTSAFIPLRWARRPSRWKAVVTSMICPKA